MSFECPSCEKSFDSEHGVKVHHSSIHGESLAKQECTCNNCGETFEEFESRIKAGKGIYCPKDCHYSTGRTIIECVRCGTTAEKPKHRSGRYSQEYCSRECYLSYRREGGKAAPGYIDGRTLPAAHRPYYGPNWLTQRRKTLERDNFTCQVCYITEESYDNLHSNGLHVHHVIPLYQFKTEDGTDFHKANQLKNLVTLCHPCHAKWEGVPVKPETAAAAT